MYVRIIYIFLSGCKFTTATPPVHIINSGRPRTSSLNLTKFLRVDSPFRLFVLCCANGFLYYTTSKVGILHNAVCDCVDLVSLAVAVSETL